MAVVAKLLAFLGSAAAVAGTQATFIWITDEPTIPSSLIK